MGAVAARVRGQIQRQLNRAVGEESAEECTATGLPRGLNYIVIIYLHDSTPYNASTLSKAFD